MVLNARNQLEESTKSDFIFCHYIRTPSISDGVLEGIIPGVSIGVWGFSANQWYIF